MSDKCLILLGDHAVGKTSIISKYLRGELPKEYKYTLGTEKFVKKLEINGDTKNIAILDSSAEITKSPIGKNFFTICDGIFVLYDSTKKESFENIDNWINFIKKSNKTLPIILIGNKSDLEREIGEEEGRKKAEELEIDFYETSALTGENVNEVFNAMLNKVFENDVEVEEEKKCCEKCCEKCCDCNCF